MELLELFLDGVVKFFKFLFRLIFNPVTEILINTLDFFDQFFGSDKKKKKQ
jgi:hypothetical protein